MKSPAFLLILTSCAFSADLCKMGPKSGPEGSKIDPGGAKICKNHAESRPKSGSEAKFTQLGEITGFFRPKNSLGARNPGDEKNVMFSKFW